MSPQRDSGKDAIEPRWPITLRNAAATGLGSGLISLPLKFFGLMPEVAVVRLFAIVTFASAIAYMVRWEMHRQILKLHGAKGRLHVAAVTLEGLVALSFLLCGPACFVWPDGGRQFVAALVLLACVFAIALVMTWLAKHRGLTTGTEVADHCGLVRFIRYDVLEPFEHVGVFRWLKERWDLVAPKDKVSYLTLWLCATLVTVACANVTKVAPPVYRALRGNSAESSEIGLRSLSPDVPTRVMASAAVAPVASYSPDPPPQNRELGYSDLCPSPDPGAPAPEPQRGQLYSQWLGPDGLGAVFGGCANPAHRLANGVWYAVGSCNGAVRSLAVAAPGAPGAILLWAPARFSLARAREGSLLSATSSQLVGEGEVYTVTTDDGTYAFLRDRLTDGGAGFAGVPRRCGEIQEGAIPYFILPPALSRLWSEQIEVSGAWLWPVSESPVANGGHDYVFREAYPGGDRKIIGSCTSDLNCELQVDGTVSYARGAGPIDVRATLDHAP